jgi:hypothetical protein
VSRVGVSPALGALEEVRILENFTAQKAPLVVLMVGDLGERSVGLVFPELIEINQSVLYPTAGGCTRVNSHGTVIPLFGHTLYSIFLDLEQFASTFDIYHLLDHAQFGIPFRFLCFPRAPQKEMSAFNAIVGMRSFLTSVYRVILLPLCENREIMHDTQLDRDEPLCPTAGERLIAPTRSDRLPGATGISSKPKLR